MSEQPSGLKEMDADEQRFYDACRWALDGAAIDALGPTLAALVRRHLFCDRLGITPAQYDGMATEDRARFYILWQARHDAQQAAQQAANGKTKLVLASSIN